MENSNDIVKIDVTIDLKTIRETIDEALDLNDNEELFNKLVDFARTKKILKDAQEQIESVEADVKGLIKAKANALYGNEWEALKGDNYKITKSPTGAVFAINGKVKKQFLVVKESVDTKLVNKFIKEEGKLPAGIDYNPERGSSIRITVHEDEDS